MKEKLLVVFFIIVPAALLVFFMLFLTNASAEERKPKTACELIAYAAVDSMLETQWFHDAGEYLEKQCNNKRIANYAYKRYCVQLLSDYPLYSIDTKTWELCTKVLGSNSRFLRPRDN